MIEPEIKATLDDGSPIETLNNLIRKRNEVLRECTRNATIAVMIDALLSIRALTLSAEKRKKFDILVEDTGWYGGFSKTEMKPVVRMGASPYSKKVGGLGKVVWLTHGIKQQSQRHVYRVTSEYRSKLPYYIVAGSPKIALDYEKKASLHRVQNKGGLAKNALTVAMNKLASTTKSLSGSTMCKNLASTLSTVSVSDGGETFSARVTDELDYATEALKGGSSSIDIALKKAANKVAGMLIHFGGKRLEEEIGTPFPEVKKG